MHERIIVVGASGSGKTTLAAAIGRRLALPHVELDALHWDANWTEAPLLLFRERVEAALSGDRWVADGNYSKVRDLVWSRAETHVWLDYARPLVMYRLLTRTLARTLTRKALWNGNREELREAFFSRKSLLLWSWHQHPRQRRVYPELLASPEFRHLETIRLRTPREADGWLRGIAVRESAEDDHRPTL